MATTTTGLPTLAPHATYPRKSGRGTHRRLTPRAPATTAPAGAAAAGHRSKRTDVLRAVGRGAEAAVELTCCALRCRGRGIPGFTGTTPAPHLRAPVKPLEDPSATYAINAYDQRRPWTSGVRGYMGHQLPPQYQGVVRAVTCMVHAAQHQSVRALLAGIVTHFSRLSMPNSEIRPCGNL